MTRLEVMERRARYYASRRHPRRHRPPYIGEVPRSLVRQLGPVVDPDDYSHPDSDVRTGP